MTLKSVEHVIDVPKPDGNPSNVHIEVNKNRDSTTHVSINKLLNGIWNREVAYLDDETRDALIAALEDTRRVR